MLSAFIRAQSYLRGALRWGESAPAAPIKPKVKNNE